MSQYEGDLEEKKFLGSGGYVYAKLTEQEEIKANLEVAHLFLGSVGRLSEVGFQDITAIRKYFFYATSLVLLVLINEHTMLYFHTSIVNNIYTIFFRFSLSEEELKYSGRLILSIHQIDDTTTASLNLQTRL
jgi:hypothetical protein